MDTWILMVSIPVLLPGNDGLGTPAQFEGLAEGCGGRLKTRARSNGQRPSRPGRLFLAVRPAKPGRVADSGAAMFGFLCVGRSQRRSFLHDCVSIGPQQFNSNRPCFIDACLQGPCRLP